jgi:hypothetical protein
MVVIEDNARIAHVTQGGYTYRVVFVDNQPKSVTRRHPSHRNMWSRVWDDAYGVTPGPTCRSVIHDAGIKVFGGAEARAKAGVA